MTPHVPPASLETLMQLLNRLAAAIDENYDFYDEKMRLSNCVEWQELRAAISRQAECEGQQVNEFRRELLDKMEVYHLSALDTVEPIRKAIVQQQCLDFMSDLFRAAFSGRSDPATGGQARLNEQALLTSLNVALFGVSSHTYPPGVVDRVLAWIRAHCGPQPAVDERALFERLQRKYGAAGLLQNADTESLRGTRMRKHPR